MKEYNKSIEEYADVRSAMEYARELAKKQGMEEGLKEGLLKGKIKGLREGKLVGEIESKKEIARNCLNAGFSVEKTSELTELSIEEISKL